MKRWPILLSFVLFVGLCVSVTYWAMQFFKPQTRAVAAPKPQVKVDVDPEAAMSLFGGRASTLVASNFQLKGVVVSSNAAESIAILSADGKPADAVRFNTEAIPGVIVKEVHAQYVLLSDNGVIKRVELPVTAPPSHGDSPLGMQTPPPMPAPVAPPVQAEQANIGQMPAPQAPSANPTGDPTPPPPPPPNLPSARIGRAARGFNNVTNRN